MLKDIDRSEQGLRNIIKNVPFFPDVILKLNHNHIRYGIYSGSFVAIASNERETSDVDIVVQDDDVLLVRKLFPFAQSKDIGSGQFMYIGMNNEIELIARSDVRIGEKLYRFRLTPLAWRNTLRLFLDGMQFNVMNPVDTILMKSILQRGQDIGKHDFEDIERLLRTTEIDHKYLRKRLPEINADDRVLKVLQHYNLLIKEY